MFGKNNDSKPREYTTNWEAEYILAQVVKFGNNADIQKIQAHACTKP